MSGPVRIQRKRSKGWRMPDGAVYVGRPTKWGNPFAVIDVIAHHCGNERAARQDVVDAYRKWLYSEEAYLALAFHVDVVNELRGKDLACWCPLDQPCHADVLLALANAQEREP